MTIYNYTCIYYVTDHGAIKMLKVPQALGCTWRHSLEMHSMAGLCGLLYQTRTEIIPDRQISVSDEGEQMDNRLSII